MEVSNVHVATDLRHTIYMASVKGNPRSHYTAIRDIPEALLQLPIVVEEHPAVAANNPDTGLYPHGPLRRD